MNQADKNIESLFQNLQAEASFADASRKTACVEDPVLVEANVVSRGEAEQTIHNTSADPAIAQVNMREELITLAESGKIKYTVNYIKKASNATLDKIKADYERKHLDETNDYVANNILSSITELLKYFTLVENPDELEQDLKKNYLLKRDIKNIVGTITPSIPYVGLLCGGVTVGKHIAMNAVTPDRPSTKSFTTTNSQAEDTEDKI